jgi:hypothetical protein
VTLPISACPVAGIIDMSYCMWPLFLNLLFHKMRIINNDPATEVLGGLNEIMQDKCFMMAPGMWNTFSIQQKQQ